MLLLVIKEGSESNLFDCDGKSQHNSIFRTRTSHQDISIRCNRRWHWGLLFVMITVSRFLWHNSLSAHKHMDFLSSPHQSHVDRRSIELRVGWWWWWCHISWLSKRSEEPPQTTQSPHIRGALLAADRAVVFCQVKMMGLGTNRLLITTANSVILSYTTSEPEDWSSRLTIIH